MAHNSQKLGIGAVSNATGIPAPTLRTWERRYGFPDPERNDAGHRIYDPGVVEPLRLARRAIETDYRASQVVGASAEELRELLKASKSPPPSEAADTEGPGPGKSADWLQQWLEAAAELDGRALEHHFHDAWNRLGGLEFLKRRASPFLNGVGDAWSNGRLDVVHEHYTSEILRDFLTSKWRALSDRASGPLAVCATLSGERHALGLHLAACVLAMGGWELIFLGADTPPEDLKTAAEREGVQTVAVSVSPFSDSEQASRQLDDLAAGLPDDVDLVVGGGGAERVPDRATRFEDLDEFYRWAFERA